MRALERRLAVKFIFLKPRETDLKSKTGKEAAPGPLLVITQTHGYIVRSGMRLVKYRSGVRLYDKKVSQSRSNNASSNFPQSRSIIS